MVTLAGAVERVARGETVIDAELIDLLLHRPGTKGRLDELTGREREVLTLPAEGLTDPGLG
jgi:DNA-binding NarL/FixJ family response regulator